MMDRAHRRRSRFGVGARGLSLASALGCLVVLTGYAPNAIAAEDGEPEWSIEGDLTGKFVADSKSGSSFKQDHNIRSGADLRVEMDVEWEDNRTWNVTGFGQSGEQQGYFVSDYDKLGEYGLLVDFSSWREFYNARTGRLDELADGSNLDDFFPSTNDGREIYGDGSPRTDWMEGGFVFDYDSLTLNRDDLFLRDMYADFHFRRVDGDQTLAKGSSLFTDTVNQVFPGATGYVDFALPSQKEVDYRSYMASFGAGSNVLDTNWQFDFSYAHHDLEAETAERNFSFDPDDVPPPVLPGGTDPVETEYFIEDTKLQVGKFDFAVARHITPSFYMYGGGMFSYERSDPDPSQDVGGPGFRVETRQTQSSKVTRLTPVVSVGSVFQPVPAVVVRVDTSFKYSKQEGRLTEFRDESGFDTGITNATLISRVDRDDYVGRANMSIDAKLAPRLRATFDARYRYRKEIVDSRRVSNAAGLPALQLEEFESEKSRIDVGLNGRYRFRRGRTAEVGYQFRHENAEVEVDELFQQFILNDYDIYSHRVYAKARGRVVGKLRGDVRFEYINERRDMESPFANPDIFAVDSGSGMTEREIIGATPTLYYQYDDNWSFSGALSVQQVRYEIIDADSRAANQDRIADFEYDAVTETVTVAGTYRPDDDWSASLSYSVFNSDDSVDNIGHSARLAGDWEIDDTWHVHGQYGFYLYRRDGTSVDDYNAHVISLGIDARF